MSKQKKVMLVGSSGGHLAQLLILREWWEKYDRVWVTFNKMDAVSALKNEKVYWAYHPTNRNVWNLLRNTYLACKLLLQARPSTIISTGAGVAVPFFYLAKLLGIKTIYLEVYDRITSASLTGKIVYPITDLFCVQWERQKEFYPKAMVVGELL